MKATLWSWNEQLDREFQRVGGRPVDTWSWSFALRKSRKHLPKVHYPDHLRLYFGEGKAIIPEGKDIDRESSFETLGYFKNLYFFSMRSRRCFRGLDSGMILNPMFTYSMITYDKSNIDQARGLETSSLNFWSQQHQVNINISKHGRVMNSNRKLLGFVQFTT